MCNLKQPHQSRLTAITQLYTTTDTDTLTFKLAADINIQYSQVHQSCTVQPGESLAVQPALII